MKVKRGGPSHVLNTLHAGHGPEDFSVGHRYQPICPMRNQVPESLRNLPKVTEARAGKLKDPDVQVLGGKEKTSLFPSEDLPMLSRSWKGEAGPHCQFPNQAKDCSSY